MHFIRWISGRMKWRVTEVDSDCLYHGVWNGKVGTRGKLDACIWELVYCIECGQQFWDCLIPESFYLPLKLSLSSMTSFTLLLFFSFQVRPYSHSFEHNFTLSYLCSYPANWSGGRFLVCLKFCYIRSIRWLALRVLHWIISRARNFKFSFHY